MNKLVEIEFCGAKAQVSVHGFDDYTPEQWRAAALHSLQQKTLSALNAEMPPLTSCQSEFMRNQAALLHEGG